MLNNKKNILYLITRAELGGAQRYVLDLANNLQGEFNITVAFGKQDTNGELAEKLKIAGINNYNIPHLKRAISPIDDFLALVEIIKLIKKIKPNIIHLNSSKISILGSIASLIIKFQVSSFKFQVVYTVHGWVFNEPLPRWLKLFYFWAEKITALFKNKIICVSEFDRQIALTKKIAAALKLITIHNGLAPIEFYSKEEARQRIHSVIPASEPESSVQHHEQVSGLRVKPAMTSNLLIGSSVIPASEPESSVQHHEQVSGLRVKPAMTSNLLIGSTGNLYKTKGFEHFIKASKIISEQKISATFIIIGEGEERKKLETLIRQNNLANDFILTGRINEAAKLLPAFDIYICSSVKEGLSYTIIEAMQAGLPIAATNVGGNGELIEDNITGLLAEAGNPESLAQKIIELIKNPALKNKLGQQAKLKAREEFCLEKMVEETKKAYSSL